MSKDAIDKWLDALRFDIYRLGVKPDPLHADTLQVEIDRLERLPVTAMGNDLHARLDDLESAKQDLASIQQLIGLTIHLRNLRDQMRENGFLKYSLADADQVLDGLHAWLEKTKREQRERQWRNLAFFRRFWPEADGSTRRQMVQLTATYSRRRLGWGVMNLQIGTAVRIGRWASRMHKRC